MTKHVKAVSGGRAKPKYEVVREKLRKEILRGSWAPGMRLPPDTELHKRFKVNRLTAVQALNELVREGLVVRRRGVGTFVADVLRPPPIPGRSLKLGLLWPRSVSAGGLRAGFDADITRGALREWGLEEVVPTFTAKTENDVTRALWRQPARGLTVDVIGEAWAVTQGHPPAKDVRDGRFDGLLAAGIVENEWIEEILDLGVPTVLVDYPGDHLATRADHVFVDPMAGYRAAVRHLARQGAHRIHFVGLLKWQPGKPAGVSWADDPRGCVRTQVEPDSYLRLSAYRQEMEALGLPVKAEWIHFARAEKRDLDALAVRLLQLPPEDRPQAFVAHQASQAEQMIAGFARHGVAVRGAGAGDHTYQGRALPVLVDGEQVGAVAADLLVSRLQKPERPFLNVGVRMLFGQDGAGRRQLTAQRVARA
jgi:DNA-binding LacI/PurR family transcriptional regulator